jgi:hypothetical protein
MSRARPLPDQRSLFPEPASEVIGSLKTWPDADLLHLARAVGYELIRRKSALPVALPVGEAISQYLVPSTQ